LSRNSSTPRPRRQNPNRRNDRTSSATDPTVRINTIVRPRAHIRAISVVALAMLVGLTSWAIASVAAWLVGVYASVMVLIFALPRGERADEDHRRKDEERTTRPGNAHEPNRSGQDLRESSTASAHGRSLTSASGATPFRAESSSLRRVRTRVRKADKPALDPPMQPTYASWVQVSPGKFVRADAQKLGTAPTPEPHAPIGTEEPSVDETWDKPIQLDETPSITEAAGAKAGQMKPLPDHEAEIPTPGWPDAPPMSSTLSEEVQSGGFAGESTNAEAPALLPVRVDARNSERMRLNLRHAAQRASNARRRASLVHGLRNVSSSRTRSSRGWLGQAISARWRAHHARSSGRYSRTHRSFQPRSPPPRS
jgi:hypothetical protein